MFQTKKPIYKVLTVIGVVLLVAALALCIIRFTQPGQELIWGIHRAICIIAMFAGFAYMLNGYRKNAAEFYRGFMLLFCIEMVMQVVFDQLSMQNRGNGIFAILLTVVCVNICILTFAKDLGKTTSMGLVCASLGITLINDIRMMIVHSGVFGIVTHSIVDIVLVCVACLFVVEKYADKAARGSK